MSNTTHDRRPTALDSGLSGGVGPWGHGDGGQVARGDTAVLSQAPLTKADGYSAEFLRELCRLVRRSQPRRARIVRTEPMTSNCDEIKRRLRLYEETGKRGYLVDLTYAAMKEWEATP